MVKFTKDGRIEELGSLQVVCNESFLNYGSIRVQGQLAIEAGAFTNQALWDPSVPWEPSMIGDLGY